MITNTLKSIWNYRQFILSSIKNELIVRFARSRIGGVWMIIHPLIQVAIYALILSAVLSAKLPGVDNTFAYAIYLTAGILAWSLFSEIVTRCLTLFIDNGDLMKKMVFPRLTLPLIVVGSSLLNNVLLLMAIIVIFLLFGHAPNLTILWLPFLIAVVVMLALSIGLIFGILNVFLRDVGQVIPLILQLGFWMTPIVYPIDIIPSYLRSLLALNPMVPIVSAYQSVLLYGKSPDISSLIYITAASATLMLFGLMLFRKAAPEMVDVL